MGLPVSPQATLSTENFFWVLVVLTGENIKFKKLTFFFQCDRQSTSLAKSQAGFISFIVLPAFKVLSTSSQQLASSIVLLCLRYAKIVEYFLRNVCWHWIGSGKFCFQISFNVVTQPEENLYFWESQQETVQSRKLWSMLTYVSITVFHHFVVNK